MKRIIAVLTFLTLIAQLQMSTGFPIETSNNYSDGLARNVVEKFLTASINKLVAKENGKKVNFMQLMQNLNSFKELAMKRSTDSVTMFYPENRTLVINPPGSRELEEIALEIEGQSSHTIKPRQADTMATSSPITKVTTETQSLPYYQSTSTVQFNTETETLLSLTPYSTTKHTSMTKLPFGGNLNLSETNQPNKTDLITSTGELVISTSSKEPLENVKHFLTTKQPTTLPETNPLKTYSFDWNGYVSSIQPSISLKFIGSLENLPAKKQPFSISTNLPETNSPKWNSYANRVNPPDWLKFTRNLGDLLATNATETIPPVGSSVHSSVADVSYLLGNQNPNETLDSTRPSRKHVQVDFFAADATEPVMRLEPMEITTTEEGEEKYTKSEDITTEESEDPSILKDTLNWLYAVEEFSIPEEFATPSGEEFLDTTTDSQNIFSTFEEEDWGDLSTENPTTGHVWLPSATKSQEVMVIDIPSTDDTKKSSEREGQHPTTEFSVPNKTFSLSSGMGLQNSVTDLFIIQEVPLPSVSVTRQSDSYLITNYDVQTEADSREMEMLTKASSEPTENYQDVVLRIVKTNNTELLDTIPSLAEEENRYNLEMERKHLYDILAKFFQGPAAALGIKQDSESRNYGLYNLTDMTAGSTNMSKIDYLLSIPLNASQYVDLEGEPGYR